MVLVWKCFTKMVYFVSVFYENLNKLSIINLAGCWPEDWILMNSNITWIHNFCLRFNFEHWIQHVKIIKSRLCRNSMLSYFICLPLFFTSLKIQIKSGFRIFRFFCSSYCLYFDNAFFPSRVYMKFSCFPFYYFISRITIDISKITEKRW